jgi:UDPglucose 6-dehydrogenase
MAIFKTKPNKIKPCVIGLGKLGLPLAAVLANNGFNVVGLDRDEKLISKLSSKNFHSTEPKLENYLNKNRNNLNFTSDFSLVKSSDIFFVIVPTPSDESGKFSNDYILMALNELLDNFYGEIGEKTIVIVSTVMPGTCQNLFFPIIKKWNLNNSKELKINLVYSPEFIALGSVIYNLENPDMTLVGCKESGEASDFLEVMHQITTKKCETKILTWNEAEIVKLLVNCFVTMKISFANFIGEISNRFEQVNPYHVADALGVDSRIGGKYLRPGLGFAGPCFPRDNLALVKFAEELSISADLAISTDKINSRMPSEIAQKILNNYPEVQKIDIFGIAYKPHTNVIEKSQTLEIAKFLMDHGRTVNLFDPIVDSRDLLNFSCSNNLSELTKSDLVVTPYEFSKLPVFEGLNVRNLLII